MPAQNTFRRFQSFRNGTQTGYGSCQGICPARRQTIFCMTSTVGRSGCIALCAFPPFHHYFPILLTIPLEILSKPGDSFLLGRILIGLRNFDFFLNCIAHLNLPPMNPMYFISVCGSLKVVELGK